MKKSFCKLPAPLVALALGLTPLVAPAEDDDEIPWDEAELFFELNNTDGDLGIHSLIDGEPWKRLKIEDKHERVILDVKVKGRLRKQGLTELFFESAEPPFESDDPDEVTLTPEEFFKRFPPGTYEIEGRTLEGEELESEVELTHVMPAPPETSVNGEEEAEDCPTDAPSVSAPITISWDAVTHSHPDLGVDPQVGVEINNYQLVVEFEDGDLSFILPPDVTQVTIPADLLLDDSGVIKYEVLAREESYNQTATESCFNLQ